MIQLMSAKEAFTNLLKLAQMAPEADNDEQKLEDNVAIMIVCHLLKKYTFLETELYQINEQGNERQITEVVLTRKMNQ